MLERNHMTSGAHYCTYMDMIMVQGHLRQLFLFQGEKIKNFIANHISYWNLPGSPIELQGLVSKATWL